MNKNKSLNRHTIHQWKSLRPLIADKKRGRQTMIWLDSITDSNNEFEQTPEDSGQRSLVCYSP